MLSVKPTPLPITHGALISQWKWKVRGWILPAEVCSQPHALGWCLESVCGSGGGVHFYIQQSAGWNCLSYLTLRQNISPTSIKHRENWSGYLSASHGLWLHGAVIWLLRWGCWGIKWISLGRFAATFHPWMIFNLYSLPQLGRRLISKHKSQLGPELNAEMCRAHIIMMYLFEKCLCTGVLCQPQLPNLHCKAWKYSTLKTKWAHEQKAAQVRVQGRQSWGSTMLTPGLFLTIGGEGP